MAFSLDSRPANGRHLFCPQDVLSDWQNLDQKHHHFKLFEHLLELLGGEIMHSFDVMQSVKSAPLSELLDLAEGG